ncbi:hypothetical protein [Mesorhizobium sp. M0633]|uniref:hypothetical protein n=1 Tax=Mesorhizobium sp. M0633 TaxID=2956977 RepID=UPI003335AEFB
MREHWSNCVTHFDSTALDFIARYFARPDRKCLLIGGAGFDPRSQIVSKNLAAAQGGRLRAIYIREERGQPDRDLVEVAEGNEAALKAIAPGAEVWAVPIFDEQDNAPIGGARIAERLRRYKIPDDVTDIVLDMSALSLGVAFPAAKLVLERSEGRPTLNFHLMIASDPDLDARIVAEPSARSQAVRGFSGALGMATSLRPARIWLPQLAPGKRATLAKIRVGLDDIYKVCPILPFPATDPRRADALIQEYGEEIRGDWSVDPRDYMYVSERNPLDAYRTLDTLKHRYDRTVEGVFAPQLILSPVGSKVMAAGAMMAAIRHSLPVQYVEALRYDINPQVQAVQQDRMTLVHLWLDGSIYDSYGVAAAASASSGPVHA